MCVSLQYSHVITLPYEETTVSLIGVGRVQKMLRLELCDNEPADNVIVVLTYLLGTYVHRFAFRLQIRYVLSARQPIKWLRDICTARVIVQCTRSALHLFNVTVGSDLRSCRACAQILYPNCRVIVIALIILQSGIIMLYR